MKRVPTGYRTEEHRLLYRYAATQAAISGDGATLEPLGGWVRTKESSIGAIGNVTGGIGQMITGNGGRIRGVLRVGQGVLDAIDIVPSVAADGIRNVAGTPSNTHTPSGYNITRALRHVTDIRTDDPVNAIKDTVAVVADNVHALVFKPGSDALKAARSLAA